jgi:ribosomal protein S18 acetylase RimI-like enzyme
VNGARKHIVRLSSPALHVLSVMSRDRQGLAFQEAAGRTLSKMSMLMFLRDLRTSRKTRSVSASWRLLANPSTLFAAPAPSPTMLIAQVEQELDWLELSPNPPMSSLVSDRAANTAADLRPPPAPMPGGCRYQGNPLTMTSIIILRSARPADLRAIGRLGALLVAEHHHFDPDRFLAATPSTEHAYAAFLGRELGRQNALVLVAERTGVVVGYSYAGIEGKDYMAFRGPAGVLYDLVIDPAHRRQGVGRMLLEAAVAELAARGAPRIVLSTAERNEAAQRLFASASFRCTMIEMTRELADTPERLRSGLGSSATSHSLYHGANARRRPDA